VQFVVEGLDTLKDVEERDGVVVGLAQGLFEKVAVVRYFGLEAAVEEMNFD
jgi:hypothetical protein